MRRNLHGPRGGIHNRNPFRGAGGGGGGGRGGNSPNRFHRPPRGNHQSTPPFRLFPASRPVQTPPPPPSDDANHFPPIGRAGIVDAAVAGDDKIEGETTAAKLIVNSEAGERLNGGYHSAANQGSNIVANAGNKSNVRAVRGGSDGKPKASKLSLSVAKPLQGERLNSKTAEKSPITPAIPVPKSGKSWASVISGKAEPLTSARDIQTKQQQQQRVEMSRQGVEGFPTQQQQQKQESGSAGPGVITAPVRSVGGGIHLHLQPSKRPPVTEEEFVSTLAAQVERTEQVTIELDPKAFSEDVGVGRSLASQGRSSSIAIPAPQIEVPKDPVGCTPEASDLTVRNNKTGRVLLPARDDIQHTDTSPKEADKQGPKRPARETMPETISVRNSPLWTQLTEVQRRRLMMPPHNRMPQTPVEPSEHGITLRAEPRLSALPKDPIAPSKIKDARAVVTSELAKLDINLFADVESDGSGAHNLPRLPIPSSGTWPPLERTHPFWNQLLHPGIQTLTQQQLFDLATNLELQKEIRSTVALHLCPIQTAFPELHTRTATAHPAALATLFFSSPSRAPAAGSAFSEQGTIKLIIVADYFQQGIRSVPHMVQRGWIVSYQDLRDWAKAEGVQGEFTIFRVDDVDSGFERQRKLTVGETEWRRAVVVEERLLIVEKSVLELGEKHVESREAA